MLLNSTVQRDVKYNPHIYSQNTVLFMVSSLYHLYIYTFLLVIDKHVAVACLAILHINNGLVGILHRDLLNPGANSLL